MKTIFITEYLERGWASIKNNPQILYTAFTAFVVVASFLFTSQLFLNIVVDTQERFEKHRLSSMHDAFVILAGEELEDSAFLEKAIVTISSQNETIISFKVLRALGTERVVVASLNPGEIGETNTEESFLYSAALLEPTSSFSREEEIGGQRVFRVVRAILGDDGKVLGWVSVVSSLSAFDELTRGRVRTSYFVLFLVVAFILFLLIRHAKIIDYTTLYKRLKEVDRMKDDFVSMASHELRSPLTIIRGYVDIVRGSKNLEENDIKNLSNIDLATKRLDNLVADILDVSRLEQGRMKFEFTNVDITALSKEIVESYMLQASEKNLSLLFKEEGSSLYISADVNKLREIITNLLSNAIKYTEKGEIVVSVADVENMVELRVSDTGIGISSLEQSKLFQKFYRVGGDKTKDIPGTGLGLWITSQLVKNMRGKISVESIGGVGTHFIVKFPRIKPTE